MHRIFIAINLPQEVKKELIDHQEEITSTFSGRCPVAWTRKENLHLTLIFIGNTADNELLEICRISREVAKRNQQFFLTLNKICYGPPKATPPRMVWVAGEKCQKLTVLKNDLEKSLLKTGGANFSLEKRDFSPHITLGRIKTWQFKQLEPEERPEIDEEVSFNFPVNSIEVMESELKRGGPTYTILESTPLG